MNLKLCTLLMVLCLLAGRVLAGEMLTAKGKVYYDAQVTSVEHDGVRISHQDGVAFIRFDDLPASWQSRYGWTPEKSAALKAQKAAEEAQAEQRRLVAAQAEAERQRQIAAEAQVQTAKNAAAAQEQADRAAAEKQAQEQARHAAQTAQETKRNRMIAMGLCIYFFPAIIGFRKRNGFAILVLNLFLGWTFFGWVLALIWACLRDQSPNVVQHTTTHHYTFNSASGQVEEAEIVEGQLKPVSGRVLSASDNPRLSPGKRELPPRG